MRKLVLKMSVSVDGFVAGPNGELDWIFRSMDETATAWTVDNVWQAGVHIMGSRTYYDMAAYWPTSTEVFAAPMNEIPKVIFSRSGLPKRPNAELTTRALKDASARRSDAGKSSPANSAAVEGWANPRVASGDLAEEIARLKKEPGKDIMAHGGAGFARSLVQRGLIDEYRLLIHPVALGSGLALFGALSKPVDLKLLSATPFGGGAVAHVYRPVVARS
jgi:dihydrofolate reductase